MMSFNVAREWIGALPCAMLASLSGMGSLRDLIDGPVVRQIRVVSETRGTYTPLDGEALEEGYEIAKWSKPGDSLSLTLLRHTKRAIKVAADPDMIRIPRQLANMVDMINHSLQF